MAAYFRFLTLLGAALLPFGFVFSQIHSIVASEMSCSNALTRLQSKQPNVRQQQQSVAGSCDRLNPQPSCVPSLDNLSPAAAFRIFSEESVDVAIIEVGLGGRLDSTNCIRTPVVCGISALGFDHMHILGHTLPVILSPTTWFVVQYQVFRCPPDPPDLMLYGVGNRS